MNSKYVSLLALLVMACGSSNNDSSEEKSFSPPVESTVNHDFLNKREIRHKHENIFVQLEDAGVALDASYVENDASLNQCAPRIGHCLTHMASLCYETSYDDTEVCVKTGLSSGWNGGSCELFTVDGNVRTNGGCMIGCNLSYTFPLGGLLPSDKSRADAKFACEEAGGTFLNVNAPISDPTNSSTN
jgi:hypothetical protein